VKWEAYDPTWLVDIAKRERATDTWLIEALARCTRAWISCKSAIYFVDVTNPNQPGSEWQFKKNILLNDKRLVLDVLKDGRIGGVEFLDRFCNDEEHLSKER
jgi:hypothetical protein